MAGQSLQARLPVERAVDLVQRPAQLAVQVGVHGRVEVAGAGAHHQALQRRQPHRGVDRLAAPHGGGRRSRCRGAARRGWCRPGARPRRPRPRRRRTRATCRGTRSGGSGAPRARPRDGVGVGVRRHRLVERGVEDRDLRHVGEELRRDLDALEVGRVVQRRQRDQVGDRGDHLVVDQHRLGEAVAAVDDAVARPRRTLDVGQRRAVVLERVDGGAQRVLERRRTPAPRCAPRRPSVCVRPPGVLADPLHRARPPAASPVSPSTRLYFSDDEPALTTSTRAVTRASPCACRLRLDRGDRDGVDDVAHRRAAGQVVDRLAQALQDRADRQRAGRALHRLVGVVAGVEVGEDEDRRPAGHLRTRAAWSGPRRRRSRRRTGSGPRRAGRARARAPSRWPRSPSRRRCRDPEPPVE